MRDTCDVIIPVDYEDEDKIFIAIYGEILLMSM
jgi:hypothetical protein